MAQFLLQCSSKLDLKTVVLQKLSILLPAGHSWQSLEQKLKDSEDDWTFCCLVVTGLAEEKPKAQLVSNICDTLVHHLSATKQHTLILSLLQLYADTAFPFSLKLKLFSGLVNIMNDDNQVKTKAILKIFDISIQNKKFSQLYIVLQNAKPILADLDIADRRIIYSKLYQSQRTENKK